MNRVVQRVGTPVLAVLLATVLAVAMPPSAFAGESKLRTATRDALWGGALGTLVGAAVLAFVDNPEDHLDYIWTGAAVGVLGGAAWGIYDASTGPDLPWLLDGKATGRLPGLSLSRRPLGPVEGRYEVIIFVPLAGFSF